MSTRRPPEASDVGDDTEVRLAQPTGGRLNIPVRRRLANAMRGGVDAVTRAGLRGVVRAVPKDGSVVVAVLDGELTIKRLRITPGGVVLQADNPRFPDIRVPALSELTIWGVATTCLHHI